MGGAGGPRRGGRGGGDGYFNDYDWSGLVDDDPNQPGATPEQRLNHFLYGGKMPRRDRTALLSGWEESNGRKPPDRIAGTPDRDWD
jgi:hypothetical protein